MSGSKQSTLSVEKEAEAQSLALRIRELADEELREMARLLLGKSKHEIFGYTEFELRGIVLKIGAKALEEHLRQKNGNLGSSIDCPVCEQAAEFFCPSSQQRGVFAQLSGLPTPPSGPNNRSNRHRPSIRLFSTQHHGRRAFHLIAAR